MKRPFTLWLLLFFLLFLAFGGLDGGLAMLPPLIVVAWSTSISPSARPALYRPARQFPATPRGY